MKRALRWLRSTLPRERIQRSDVLAGLSGAVAGVPDGMAAGALAGVSPVHGLYGSMAGRLFGSFATSTRLMVVTATSASALAAGSALTTVPPGQRSAALVLLTLFAGCVMIAASVLRLGRYTRFVSHSVMTGFLAGIAANIVFGQLAQLTGVSADSPVAVLKALQVVTRPGEINIPSLVVGVFALALLVGSARTRLRFLAAPAALILPTALMIGLGWDSVTRVSDAGALPGGFPVPHIPDLAALTPSLFGGAAAVSVIVLVQGVGVAQAVPNRDGSPTDANRDFAAQGIGSIAAALFRGMPVGGSLGQTALNATSGARTRWGAILSGVWSLGILVAFVPLVGKVPMPTLAAILIVAAARALEPGGLIAIWSSGSTSRIALVATFCATLLLPVSAAVGIGVALSLILQLNREALDLKVVRLRVEDGHLVEMPAPVRLADHQIVILDVYGSLFYAGARTLQANLPDPTGAHAPIVILRLRGRTSVSATFLAVIGDYVRRLDEADGALYLSGVDHRIRERWTDQLLDRQGVRVEFFPATPTIGESTLAAYAQARVRLWNSREE